MNPVVMPTIAGASNQPTAGGLVGGPSVAAASQAPAMSSGGMSAPPPSAGGGYSSADPTTNQLAGWQMLMDMGNPGAWKNNPTGDPMLNAGFIQGVPPASSASPQAQQLGAAMAAANGGQGWTGGTSGL